MASMFRSPEDISSDSESTSTDGDLKKDLSGSVPLPKEEDLETDIEFPGNPPLPSKDGKYSQDWMHVNKGLDPRAIPGLDAEGHAALMTASLLEFYCLSRASDILNEQQGSHGRYTRDSPEVQFLGRQLYAYKSQFLSSNGVITQGVDGEDWGAVRQYYRDSLDTLDLAALEGIDLNLKASRPGPKGGLRESLVALKLGATQKRLEGPKQANADNPTMQYPSKHDLLRRLTEFANPALFREIFHPILDLPYTPHLPLNLPLPYPQSQMLNLRSSRYATEFEEEEMIGKGSFGAVYKVKHHVDGQPYAVKKIPLSPKRLKQLQEGGLRELDNILKEIRTLARLDHANVVRYFGAWAEYSHFPAQPPAAPRPLAHPSRMKNRQRALLSKGSANDNDPSFGIVFEEPSVNKSSFDRSGPHRGIAEKSGTRPGATTASPRSRKSFVESLGEDSRDGGGEEGEEEIESIPRPFSFRSIAQTSTFSGTDEDIFSDGLVENRSRVQIGEKKAVSREAAITLHIQMSLHPVSLAKYLNPHIQSSVRGSACASPRHCYHLIPSLRIILGILSGVEYLHSKGIVHRDLKPANIFLSTIESHESGGVCPTCEANGAAVSRYMLPRIGDFGLVAHMSGYEDSKCSTASTLQTAATRKRPVGTEFYRPPMLSSSWVASRSSSRGRKQSNHPSTHCHIGNQDNGDIQNPLPVDESLDVFALGIILFELLYRLETRMERQMVLSELTCSPNNQFKNSGRSLRVPALPGDFAAKLDNGGQSVKRDSSVADRLCHCIMGMLDPDSRHRWSSKAVRHCLEEVLRGLTRETR